MDIWYRFASYFHDFFSAALAWALILAFYFQRLFRESPSLAEAKSRSRRFLLRLGLWSLLLTFLFGAVRLWDFTGKSGALPQTEAYGAVAVKHVVMVALLVWILVRVLRTGKKTPA